jgi:hypothetical protein
MLFRSPEVRVRFIGTSASDWSIRSDPGRGAVFWGGGEPSRRRRHVRRQFVAVFDEMVVFYRRSFLNIVSGEKAAADHDHHTNFAAIMCLEENKSYQKQLCDLCSDNPLALHRLWKLYRDYGPHKNVLDAINGHERRVSWQLFRIYRARNNLVHAGRTPSYLDSLILNLAEYFRGAIAIIVHRANREDSESNLDQIVADIAIEHAIFRRYFEEGKAKKKLAREDLLRLVK